MREKKEKCYDETTAICEDFDLFLSGYLHASSYQRLRHHSMTKINIESSKSCGDLQIHTIIPSESSFCLSTRPTNEVDACMPNIT